MEKLGMQLLGSAGFKVKHEFIPLESCFFFQDVVIHGTSPNLQAP